MTKQELLERVAKSTGVPKSDVQRHLTATLDAITGALGKGDTVTLVGFGTFSVSKRKARKGRNPKTGAALDIPAMRVPRFKAGKGLKDAVKR